MQEFQLSEYGIARVVVVILARNVGKIHRGGSDRCNGVCT